MNSILNAITEDDRRIAELLQDYLNNCDGYEVLFTASDGRAPISQLSDCAILRDVVLLD